MRAVLLPRLVIVVVPVTFTKSLSAAPMSVVAADAISLPSASRAEAPAAPFSMIKFVPSYISR